MCIETSVFVSNRYFRGNIRLRKRGGRAGQVLSQGGGRPKTKELFVSKSYRVLCISEAILLDYLLIACDHKMRMIIVVRPISVRPRNQLLHFFDSLLFGFFFFLFHFHEHPCQTAI